MHKRTRSLFLTRQLKIEVFKVLALIVDVVFLFVISRVFEVFRDSQRNVLFLLLDTRRNRVISRDFLF